jgi:hypothetical protein
MKYFLGAALVTLLGPGLAFATVCNDPRLSGEVVRACGIDLVRVDSAAGSSLPDGPVMSCATAERLADYAQAPVLTQPWPVVTLRTQSGAICDGIPGAQIDVRAFEFESRRERAVETGWDVPRRRGYLDNARAAACNRFDRVRSPLSGDAYATRFSLGIGEEQVCE